MFFNTVIQIDLHFDLGQAFQYLFTMIISAAIELFHRFLLVFIVYEKEKKIKEGMKMMGLSNLAYW